MKNQINNQTNIEKLVTSGKKVFTTDDLAVVWQLADRKRLLARVKYYLRQKRLTHVYKGVYAYGQYTPPEVAQKLVPLSYISLYSAAQMHGLIFQHYSTIFCMSLRSKRYRIDSQDFEYHKIKPVVFYNSLGLVKGGLYTVAGKERTVCDLLYVYPNFAFDNLRGIDNQLLRQISLIYENKRLQKAVAKLIIQIEKG